MIKVDDERDFLIGEVSEFGLTVAQVTQFLRQEWGRRIALMLPEFYEWQFLKSPDNKGLDSCVVVADRNMNLFGFLGLNKRVFTCHGANLSGAEATTMIVKKEVQRFGYASKMMEYALEKYDLFVGTSIDEVRALPMFASVGCHYVRYLPRYIKIFNLKNIENISDISPLGQKLINRECVIPDMGYTVRDAEPADIISAVNEHSKNFNGYSRDLKYLKWRYEEHPVYEYKFHYVESGGEHAIVIWREDQNDHAKFVHIIDVIGSSKVLEAVVNFINTVCSENGADFADFYCLTDQVGHVFRKYGWYSAVDDIFIQVPHLLHPVELKAPPTTSLILCSRKYMSSLLNSSCFYFTKGDCDIDRPTMHYLNEKDITL